MAGTGRTGVRRAGAAGDGRAARGVPQGGLHRALSLLLLAAACATAPPARAPLDRLWLEVRSPHFVLYTDLPRDDAERRTRELELARAMLEQAYELLVPVAPPDTLTGVVLFARCADLHAIAPGFRGVVQISVGYDDEPRIVTCAADVATERTVRHELAHVFNARPFGPLPVWLNEGLASYAETVYLAEGQIVFGRFGSESFGAGPHRIALTLDQLRGADATAFHGSPSAPTYHHAAHTLVHLLNSESEELHRRFQGYHLDPRKRVWRLRYVPPPEPRITSAMWRDVGGMWISLALAGGNRDVAAIHADVRRRDPSWRDGRYQEAVLALRRVPADRATALALLREQVIVTPRDERPRRALLSVEIDGALSDQDPPDDEPEPGLVAPFEADATALARIATSAPALNAVARYFALRRMPAVGLGFARRALERDPTCWRCLDTLALLLFHAGRREEAVAAQEVAIAISGMGDTRDMVSRLLRFLSHPR